MIIPPVKLLAALSALILPTWQASRVGGQDHNKQLILDHVQLREAYLRQAQIEYYAVTTLFPSSELYTVEHVVVDFSPSGEKWIRRKIRPSEGMASLLEEDQELPDSWIGQGNNWPITSIEVWDGSRQLALGQRLGKGWSGSLRLKPRGSTRSGPLRAGILPGERWLSERLERWTLVNRFEGRGRDYWLFVISNDEGKTDIHRIETDPARDHLVVRQVASGGNAATLKLSDIVGDRFFELTAKETLLNDDWVTESAVFDGVHLPTRVSLSQSYADTRTSATIAYSILSDTPEFDSRSIPAEVGLKGVVVWDEFLGEAIGLGDAAEESTQRAPTQRTAAIPSPEEGGDSLPRETLGRVVGPAGVLVLLGLLAWLASRARRKAS